MSWWIPGGRQGRPAQGSKRSADRSPRLERLERRNLLAAVEPSAGNQLVECGAYQIDAGYQMRRLPVETSGHPMVSIRDVFTCESRPTADFVIQLSEPQRRNVRVLVETVPGTAIPGSDYLPGTQVVEFFAGQTIRTASVMLRSDQAFDPQRMFAARVSIVNPDGSLNVADRVLVQSTSAAGRIGDLQLSDDGRYVVLSRERMAPKPHTEIVSIPLDGSAGPTRLSGPPVATATDLDASFTITADSRHVLYVVNDGRLNRRQLFRAPIDGSAEPLRLSPYADGHGLVSTSDVKLSPDGRWVAFRSRGDQSPINELYLVPLDGSQTPRRVSHVGQSVATFEFSPDATRLVYDTETSAGGLYSLPLRGGPAGESVAVELTAVLQGDYRGGTFRFADRGMQLVFGYESSLFPGLQQLYRVPVDGSSAPVAIATATAIQSPTPTPSGDRILYLDRVSSGGALGLFSVPLFGRSAASRLDGALGGDFSVSEFLINGDARFVYFVGGSASGDRSDVYRMRIDGEGSPWKLSRARSGQQASRLQLAPDGRTILYRLQDSFATELYRARTDVAESQIQLSGSVVTAGSLIAESPALISQDADFVAYAVETPAGESVLYHTRLDGRSLPQPIGVLSLTVGGDSSGATSRVVFNGRVYAYVGEGNNIRLASLYATASATLFEGQSRPLNFGDAPSASQSGFAADYPVTVAQNGARHGDDGGSLWIGGPPLRPTDGIHRIDAESDSSTEPGVEFPSQPVIDDIAVPSTVTVQAGGAGYLDAWIDFNRDGDWDDRWEQIASRLPVVAGQNDVWFAVPAEATPGGTAARFRVSRTGGLPPTGYASSGEVEDVWLQLIDRRSMPTADRTTLPLGQSEIVFDGNTVSVRSPQATWFQQTIDSGTSVGLRGEIDSETVRLIPPTRDTPPWDAPIIIDLDGNHGRDTLQLVVPPQHDDGRFHMDLTRDGMIAVRRFETIDLTIGGEVSLVIDADLVAGAGSGETLVIRGDVDDELVLHDPQRWRMGGLVEVDGSWVRELVHASGTRVRVDFPRLDQNFIEPLDVDNSGQITPLDALLVINYIAGRLGSSTDDAAASLESSLRFFDTTGDNQVTPLDALRVINGIGAASSRSAADGERVATFEPTDPPAAISSEFWSEDAVDRSMAEWDLQPPRLF